MGSLGRAVGRARWTALLRARQVCTGRGGCFSLFLVFLFPHPPPSPTHRKEHFWALPSSRRRNLQGLGGDTGDQAPERAVAALSLIFEGGGGGSLFYGSGTSDSIPFPPPPPACGPLLPPPVPSRPPPPAVERGVIQTVEPPSPGAAGVRAPRPRLASGGSLLSQNYGISGLQPSRQARHRE